MTFVPFMSLLLINHIIGFTSVWVINWFLLQFLSVSLSKQPLISWQSREVVTDQQTPLWKCICLSSYLNYWWNTYSDEILETIQVKLVSCLLAFITEDAFIRIDHLENTLMNFKHFCWAWISDGDFLDSQQFNVLVQFDLRIRHESSKRDWRPLWMHFSNPFLYFKLDLDWLILG